MFTPETLESRRLLSVSMQFDDASGVLYVTGDQDANNIRVTASPTYHDAVDLTDARPLELATIEPSALKAERPVHRPGPMITGVAVYQDYELLFHSNNTLGAIRSVVLSGGAGDDNLDVVLTNSPVTVQIDGETGDDYIEASAFQCDAPLIYGGEGNDIVFATYREGATFGLVDGGAGFDAFSLFSQAGAIASTEISVLGGDDDDRISLNAESGAPGFIVSGGEGDDWIAGSEANDELYGDNGNDWLYGGEGNDRMFGGAGYDLLYGQNGDDFLDGGTDGDFIDGGEGTDTAVFDRVDTFVSCESSPGL